MEMHAPNILWAHKMRSQLIGGTLAQQGFDDVICVVLPELIVAGFQCLACGDHECEARRSELPEQHERQLIQAGRLLELLPSLS